MNMFLLKIKFIAIKLFEKFYLIIVFLTMVIVFSVGFFNYLLQSIREIIQQGDFNLQSAETFRDKLEGHLKNLERLHDKYNEFSHQQVSKLREILPIGSDYPSLFVQLQDIAEENNLGLESIDIS